MNEPCSAPATLVRLDGSLGEGGGQVLRTALSLSLLTGRPIHLYNLRLRRPKPGLQPQHLAAVKAAAAAGQAEVRGAALNSQELIFIPGRLRPGTYRFDIGTAGATSLVLQTLFLPLCLADKSSTLLFTGGTHVPWSPCFHYLEQHWLPYLQEMGFGGRLVFEKAGFYPEGGGVIQATTRPAGELRPLQITGRGALLRIRGMSVVCNLDENIASRQKLQALRRLEPLCRDTKIKTLSLPSSNKGTFLLLLAEFEHSRLCSTALGAKGKRAEVVADEACQELEILLAGEAAVDQYLPDQLLLPMALAQGESRLTAHITPHLLTNAEVIRRFLPVRITIEGEPGQVGSISVQP
jgi:RNA 3'-phosphate cyclase